MKVLSGILLTGFLSLLVNAFLSSPPTRAEFETLKTSHELNLEYTKDALKDLKRGQENIINLLRGK